MNPNLTNDQWFSAWLSFLLTIAAIFEKKRQYVERYERRAARLIALNIMLNYLLTLLREQLSRETLNAVLGQTVEAQHSRDSIVITGAEMAFISQHYNGAQIQSEKEANEGIEAAKSVKDSIEDLFTWVPGHKTILKGLNEILSLGRAI
jgi:hypothetical protein